MKQIQSVDDTICLLAGAGLPKSTKARKRFDRASQILREDAVGHSSRIRSRHQIRKSSISLIISLILLTLTQVALAQVNAAPVAQPDFYVTALDVPVNLLPDILDNDTDADGDPITLVSFDQPENGSLVDIGGVLTYTPDAGFEGLDTFDYTITDGTDNSLGKGYVEVGNPNIDMFEVAYGDTISDGVPGPGAGNIEVGGAQDFYVFQGGAGQEAILDWRTGTSVYRWTLEAPDGTVLFQSLHYFDHRLALPQTGTYTLSVKGNLVSNIGTYSFQLLLVPAPQAFVISIGDTVSNGVPAPGAGNIEVPGAVDIYTFDAVAGDEVIFDWFSGSNVLIVWRLEDPNNNVLFDGNLADQQLSLEQSGTYTLTVQGWNIDDFDEYAFRLLRAPLSPDEFTINIGDTVSDGVPGSGAGNIEEPGAVDIYTFNATTGDEVIFDWLSGSNVLIVWRLEAPDSTILFDGSLADVQLLLGHSGTYTLTLEGRGIDDTGTYSFQLVSVPTSADIFTISIGDVVSDGVPGPGAGSLESPGALDIYNFDAVAGQAVIIDWLTGSNVQLGWRLEAPDSTMLFDSVFQDYQLVLPQTGIYSLILRGNTPDDIGLYSFELLAVPAPQMFAIDFGDTVSDGVPVPGAGNLEARGAEDHYAFAASAGQEIIVDALTGHSGQIGWRLQAPDSSILFDTPLQDQQVLLPLAGTYTLIVDGNDVDDFGIYSFRLLSSPPLAGDDVAATDEDVPITVDVLANDSDPDGDTLTIDSVIAASHGSIVNNGHDITYTPNLNFNGTDSFGYVVTDSTGNADTATVTVTVNPINDNPVAVDDTIATDEDVAVTIDVLLNDTDVEGDTLNIESVTQPTNGTVVNNGPDVTYTPHLNFFGTDTFTYTINDGNGGMDMATVSVTVNPVNDPPVANDDTASTDEDVAVTVDVLLNDLDVDGDALTIESVTQPTNGTVINNGPDVTYMPHLNFFGTDTFTYTINDGNGGTDTAIVIVTVIPVNDPPFINNPGDQSNTEGDGVTLPVGAGDIDGDPLTFNAINLPAGLSIDPSTGVIGLTVAAGAAASSPYSVSVSVADPGGLSASTTFNWTVNPGPSNPGTVTIDIKPGETPNCINNSGQGVIPVAVLGSASFDVTQIDPTTVELEGLGVRIVGNQGKLQAHIEDFNGDGFSDLVVQIENTAGAFPAGDATATLTARLYDGTLISGSDSLCIVP